MTDEIIKTDTLIVGGGQAGIAMSEHLTTLNIPHLVLEKNRVAEAWRSGRWDSLVANGPAWHDRFPGMQFKGMGQDDFVPKDRVADYLADYAEKYQAPIRTGVEVKHAARNPGRPGFRVETTVGIIEATRIVAATGPFQRPVIPVVAPRGCAPAANAFRPLQEPRAVAGGGRAGCRGGLIRRANC